MKGHNPAAALELSRVEQFNKLLEQHGTFSFLRLGDGELLFLLQEGKTATGPALRASCEIAFGAPGLHPDHYPRLLASYENCHFLDDYAQLPFNRENLPRLRWSRSPTALGRTSSGSLGLLFEWVQAHLRDHLARHRCLICGAEAALLEQLTKSETYRRLAAEYWPANASTIFLQPRGDGGELADQLDLIKEDLRRVIREQRIETLFLSLGGGAKILCHELAQELGIRALDFGSTLRSLTYSGSDGYATWRSAHHPFLLRVPLDVFLPALRAAHPRMDVPTLVAKVHAQLCLEVQSRRLLHSVTSDANDAAMFDNSPASRRHFHESMRVYQREILPLARRDPRALELAREFRRWRWKKGLGWDGRIFRAAVAAKGLLRKLAGGPPAPVP